jgi:hypothetical protein
VDKRNWVEIFVNMRLYEFSTNNTTPDSNLLTALELLRNRYKDVNSNPKIKTQSLINLVLNTDRSFNYDALVSANENNPAVKNLIKSFTRDYVILQPFGDELEDDTPEVNNTSQDVPNNSLDQMSMQQPNVNTVSDMATRAAFNRGAPVGVRL